MTERNLYAFSGDMTAGEKLFNSVLDLHKETGSFTKEDISKKSGVSDATVNGFVNRAVNNSNIKKVGEQKYGQAVYALILED